MKIIKVWESFVEERTTNENESMYDIIFPCNIKSVLGPKKKC